MKHEDRDADTTQPGVIDRHGVSRRLQRSGEGMDSIVSHLRDEESQRPGGDDTAGERSQQGGAPA